MNTAVAGAIVSRRYRIAKPLGQGGMGSVYLAEDLGADGRLVALKVLHARSGRAAEVEHFKNEFQFLAQLRHPNLAEVYDFGVTEELGEGFGEGAPQPAYYFTMEYVRGEDLYISTAGMPFDELLELVVQVCRGLEFIHTRGFVHHDVKPGNILVTPLPVREEGGARHQVKLLDFGLAATHGLTGEAAPRGTVPYMAPEMLKGLAVDRRADLYSLGAVLYQVVTRRLPFDGDSTLGVIRKHLEDDPVPPHLIRKDVPRAIESLILRLLAKEASDRLPSANMVIQTLGMLTGKRFEIETRSTRESYIMGGRFVGRDASFLLLRDAFDVLVRKVAEGYPADALKVDHGTLLSRFKNTVLISGERGIGKRRLVQEFKHRVQLAGVSFAAVDCPSEGGPPFGPFLELLRAGLHQLQSDEALFDRYAAELSLLLPGLSGRRPVKPGIELEPERERVRLVGRLADLVLEMSRRQPTVLCIRDLHWIDPMSLELVKALAHRLHALRREEIRALGKSGAARAAGASDAAGSAEDAAATTGGASAGEADAESEEEDVPHLAEGPERLPPLLLLATYDESQLEGRPAHRLVGELTAAGSAEELRLRRLTLGETSDLVKSMLGLQLLPEALARLVHEHSGGNPLFVEELMRSMVEEGVISYDRGAWRVFEERLRSFAVPAGLALLIQRRLDRVKGKDLEVLELMAAFSRPVSLESLSRLVHDHVEVVQRVGALERRGLVQRAAGAGPLAYEFAHAATRDRVYQRIADAARHEMHDRIGQDLSSPGPDGTPRGDPEECAYHLQRGRTPARALPWLCAAGDRARARYSLLRACEAYEAALVLAADATPEARENLLEKFGSTCVLVGRYDDAIRAWQDLLTSCRESAPAERIISLCTRLTEACAKKGEWDKAESYVEEGFRAADGKATAAAGRLHHQRAWLRVQRGQCREGIEECERGLELAARIGDEPLQGALYNVLGVAHLHMGIYDRSKQHLERALEICERHDDVHGLGNALNNLAALYGYTGHHRKALEEQKRVLALRERTGDRWGVVLALGNLGVISHETGDNDAAMEYFRKSLALREEIGMTHGIGNILLNVGNIEFSRGRIADALRSWDRCLDLYRRSGDLQGEALCLTNLVGLYTYCGDLVRANGELTRARELSDRLSLRREQAMLHSAEGEIASSLGEWAAADRAFKTAETMYLDLRCGADLARVRLHRAELALERGDPAAARALCAQAESDYEGSPPPTFLVLLALLRGRASAPADAVARHEEALALLPRGESPDLEWEARFLLARALEATGRAAAAEEQDVRSLEILHAAADAIPVLMRDRFASVGRRRRAWPRFLHLQGRGRLPEELATFVIRQAVKGETMDHREDLSEIDSTRKRLQVAINLLKEENKNLVKLMDINKKLNSELDLSRLLEFIIDAAVELTKAEKGFIMRLAQAGAMDIAVARNFEKLGVDQPEQQMSRSIAEEVARSGRAVLTSDATQDSRFNLAESVRDLHLASVLCVPLRVKDKILGACYIENRAARGFFTEKDRELLEAFSDQAAIAMDNARLYSENLQKQKELATSKAEVEELNRKLQEANQKLELKVHDQQEELSHVREELDHRVRELGLKYTYDNIVGRSPRMKEVFALLDRVTTSTLPVVIHGESGTGKELVARAIHFNGPRKLNQFAAENCAAITETLLESELFGYVRGAFTGADKDRKGLFEVAHQGTLFLDEIGDMSVEMQKKLLRVLESGELRRVGGKDVIKVDVRIIAASNKDLFQLTKENLFREDLYYRLNVFQVKLPPLRERKEDLPQLVEHMLERFALESKTTLKKVDASGLALLRDYEWPGNIRELKNILTGVASLTDDVMLTAQHFVEKLPNMDRNKARESAASSPQYLSIEEYTRRFILDHQDHLSDTEVAEYLGISRKTLWEKRKKWGLAR